MILITMLAVVQLLAGSPMPDRSKMMIQTKRDTWSSRLWVGCGVNNTKIFTKHTKKKRKEPNAHQELWRS